MHRVIHSNGKRERFKVDYTLLYIIYILNLGWQIYLQHRFQLQNKTFSHKICNITDIFFLFYNNNLKKLSIYDNFIWIQGLDSTSVMM